MTERKIFFLSLWCVWCGVWCVMWCVCGAVWCGVVCSKGKENHFYSR